MGYTWILTHLTLQLDYLPTMYETIRIETWVEQNAHMLSIRDFRLYLVDEEADKETIIGQGKSTWAVLDEKERTIVNLFDLPMFAGTIDGEVLEMPPSKRHAPFATADGEKTTSVDYSDCDYNNHCNSCKYVEKMLDTYIPTWQLPICLDINYIKEIYLGDSIHTSYHKEGDCIYYQQRDEQQHPVCRGWIKVERLC